MKEASDTGVFFPQRAQLALFFAPGTTFRPLLVATHLDGYTAGMFGVELAVLPLPADAPAEVPRVLAQKPGVGAFSIAFNRADLTLEVGTVEQWSKWLLERFRYFTEIVVDKCGLQVVRVGLVLTFGFAGSIGMADIVQKYIAAGKIGAAEELEIAWLKRPRVGEMVVNRWVRLHAASSPQGPRSLIIDTNTRAEEQLTLSTGSIAGILSSWLDDVRSDLYGVIEW